jgi:hypothetical protein
MLGSYHEQSSSIICLGICSHNCWMWTLKKIAKRRKGLLEVSCQENCGRRETCQLENLSHFFENMFGV